MSNRSVLEDFGKSMKVGAEKIHHGDDNLYIASGGPFSKTAVNAAATYPKHVWINERPALAMATAAASAAVTDGYQIQVADDAFRCSGIAGNRGFAQQRSKMRMRFGFRGEGLDVADLFIGLAVVDTTIIASAPTDFIGLRKLTGETVFKSVARKASGTEEATALGMPTIGNNKDYEVDMEFRRTGTGAGHIEIRIGVDKLPGDPLDDFIQTIPILTQMPDTVEMSPSFAWRVGTAASQPITYLYHMGWRLSR